MFFDPFSVRFFLSDLCSNYDTTTTDSRSVQRGNVAIIDHHHHQFVSATSLIFWYDTIGLFVYLLCVAAPRHFFSFYPLFYFPKCSLSNLMCLIKCPFIFTHLFFIVSRIVLFSLTIVNTSSLGFLSIQLMLNILRQDHISKASFFFFLSIFPYLFVSIIDRCKDTYHSFDMSQFSV